MRIVYCLDENYLEYARESIKSYRKHNPNSEIIVVSEDRIESVGEDRHFLIKLPDNLRFRSKTDRISRAAYLKLFLTKLPFDKILYVDADTICQKPLTKLWDMVPEYIALTESHAFGERQAAAFGAKKYGLTGMMMMNLINLRKIHFTEQCLDVNNSWWTPVSDWNHDETCINLALAGKLTFIDKIYNYCHNRNYYSPIPESEAYILHYVGRDKSDMFYLSQKYKSLLAIGKCIRNKRVAIVGNAKSLFDKSYGSEIDNHDFVIRFNRGFIVSDKSQGTKTSCVILALNLTQEEIDRHKARFVVNRSKHYSNLTPYRIPQEERMEWALMIGKQPSSGLLAIDFALCYKPKSLDLYGFDFEETPTFYNPEGYQTQHDYDKEKEIILTMEKERLLKINR